LASQPSSAVLTRFANFELNLRSGELRRDGTPLKLPPQPAKLLVLLVSRAGEVVTRQELVEQLWGAETFVDFEQGLNFAVRQVRAVLDDDPDSPRFLETLPKRGYRFIAAVGGTRVPAEPEDAPLVNISQPDGSGRQERAPWPRKFWRVLAGVCAVLLLGLAARQWIVPRPGPRFTSGAIQSVAVLPLANLSADPGQEYFSDGLTDELITELAKIGSLRVTSRTSVIGYKGTHKPIPEIARELHVDAVIEGTVQRVGERVRIRAQLIHGATDQHLWAAGYDRDLGDVLHMEYEVARDIAQQVGDHRSESKTQRAGGRQVSAEAHEEYLLGRYYWNKRTEAGLLRGVGHFKEAIRRDPSYALAYAGMADSYIMLANWGLASPGEAYAKATAFAARALELDPQLVEAQTSLAYTALLYDRDWAGAEKGFRQAIALNPNYVSAHHFYSICLMTSGRQAEALTEIERARELDPLSLIVNSVQGWIYYEGRRYDLAVQQYTKTLEMDPDYVPALLDLGTSYLRLGEYGNAIAQFEKARATSGENGVVLSDLAQAYALSGDKAGALKILHRLQARSGTAFVSSWDLALIHTALGEKDKAITQLQKATEEHVGWVVRLGVDPALDSLRGEPRFQELSRRIGIPWQAPV
jgi:TolB-like protein/DNA-binding winged helix-turn-helix (wHTH) protein/Tfp pilus assembly protein PilF